MMNDYEELNFNDLQGDLNEPAAAPAVQETADEAYVRRIKDAQRQIKQFTLSTLQKRLLAAACENVGSAKGNGLDAQARDEVLQRAALFTAFDNDLAKVLSQIAATVDTESAPGLAYSVCFAVQKACNFIANFWFRRALDPRDGEGTPVHDYREQREAPYGLGAEEPAEEQRYESVQEALEVLHIYLQLLTESFGWDPENPMPYLFVQEKDGRFTPMHDAGHVLDIMEVRAQTARAKRQERRSKGLAACLAGARDALLNAAR